MTTYQQPTLPAEGEYTDMENLFRAEEPAGLFPENQNSNFGALRRILTDPLQDAVDLLTELYGELFVATAVGYLGRWEDEMGIPRSSAADQVRRANLLARKKIGAFTRQSRIDIIERYIQATFGTPPQLSPGGIPFGSGGIELHAESASVKTLYRIYEDVRNFAYAVWIVNTVTPDMASLTRELQRITPAGIAVTFDNTKANILDYLRTVRNKQPVGYWPLGVVQDQSGYGYTGTANGGVAVGGAAPLVSGAVAPDQATDFDGVDDYIKASGTALFISGPQTWEAWVRPDALPATGGNYAMIQADGASNYLGIWTGSGSSYFVFNIYIGGVSRFLSSNVIPVIGQTYHVVGTWDGKNMRIYVNGVLAATGPDYSGDVSGNFDVYIGRYASASYPFNGVIDEVAKYNRALSASEILENYNTGKNIA